MLFLQTLETAGGSITVASSIIKSVVCISTDLKQDSVTQQLGRMLYQLQSGKVALGVVGLVNSGKSTMLNSLMGAKYLPASFQPQTVGTVRIVSDHATLGTLKGKTTSNDEFILLANGQEDICRRVKELNDKDRDQHTGQPLYNEMLLTAPVNFLKGRDNLKLEIFDTPGSGEFGCSTALSTSKKALKEMAALVLILDVQSLFGKMQSDLLEQIQVLHPLMMKRHHRVLVLLNKYDICYDGNEESWSLEKLCKKVSDLFDNQVPANQIIPFSAKWALESRQWLKNPHQICNDDFGAAYYFLRKTPMKDAVNGLIEQYCPGNVSKLGKHLEEFSRIGKVEEKLLEMSSTHGATILLESVIDDITREISELKEAITRQIISANISGKKEEVSQQKDLIQQVTDVVETYCKQKLITQFPPKIIADFAVHQNAVVSALRNCIIAGINANLPQLQGDHGEQNGAQECIRRVRGAVISLATQEFTKAWPQASQVMKTRQNELLANAMAELKTELVKARISEYLSFDKVNTSTIVNQIPVLTPAQPPVAGCPSVNDTIISLVVAHTVTKQKLENRTRKGHRKHGVGKRKKHHYVEAVNYQETVYRVNTASVNQAFITFADYCVDYFKTKLNEAVKASSQTVSLQTYDAIKEISNQPLWKLQHELERRMSTLEISGTKIDALESKKKELDEAAKKLLDLLPEQQ